MASVLSWGYITWAARALKNAAHWMAIRMKTHIGSTLIMTYENTVGRNQQNFL